MGEVLLVCFILLEGVIYVDFVTCGIKEGASIFLGAFRKIAKLRQATVSFLMFFRPSVCVPAWNNTGSH
jgi:hypothetical protein